MKIGILSDLHLEFGGPTKMPNNDADIYIIAGDIHPNDNKREKYIKRLEEDGKPVFHIMGNHDHWYSQFPSPNETIRSAYLGGDNGGVSIAGATLWTDMSGPLDWLDYVEYLNDAVRMKGADQDSMQETHKVHREFLFNSGADIIVSHHAPSYMSVSSRFRGDAANKFFCTEFHERIMNMDNPPKLWIHGHIHEKKDYMIGDTRVICNPWGYGMYEVHERGLIVIEV